MEAASSNKTGQGDEDEPLSFYDWFIKPDTTGGTDGLGEENTTASSSAGSLTNELAVVNETLPSSLDHYHQPQVNMVVDEMTTHGFPTLHCEVEINRLQGTQPGDVDQSFALYDYFPKSDPIEIRNRAIRNNNSSSSSAANFTNGFAATQQNYALPFPNNSAQSNVCVLVKKTSTTGFPQNGLPIRNCEDAINTFTGTRSGIGEDGSRSQFYHSIEPDATEKKNQATSSNYMAPSAVNFRNGNVEMKKYISLPFPNYAPQPGIKLLMEKTTTDGSTMHHRNDPVNRLPGTKELLRKQNYVENRKSLYDDYEKNERGGEPLCRMIRKFKTKAKSHPAKFATPSGWAEFLGVSKKRMNDIVRAMDGVGGIQHGKGRNVRPVDDLSSADQLAAIKLRRECDNMEMIENALDVKIKAMKRCLEEVKAMPMYLKLSDLRKLDTQNSSATVLVRDTFSSNNKNILVAGTEPNSKPHQISFGKMNKDGRPLLVYHCRESDFKVIDSKEKIKELVLEKQGHINADRQQNKGNDVNVLDSLVDPSNQKVLHFPLDQQKHVKTDLQQHKGNDVDVLGSRVDSSNQKVLHFPLDQQIHVKTDLQQRRENNVDMLDLLDDPSNQEISQLPLYQQEHVRADSLINDGDGVSMFDFLDNSLNQKVDEADKGNGVEMLELLDHLSNQEVPHNNNAIASRSVSETGSFEYLNEPSDFVGFFDEFSSSSDTNSFDELFCMHEKDYMDQ